MPADKSTKAQATGAAPAAAQSADQPTANMVPVLSKEAMEKNVLVGVCGAQAAGKTVFLAAVFHTMTGTVVDGIGHISSNKQAGGARYFETVENTILAQNGAAPTRESAVAHLEAETAGPGGAPSQTGILLFDFAGGHFTDFADINAAKQEASDAQTRQEIDRVAEYLEKCDAFILLIDSSQFKPDSASRTNPFSPSVIHIIRHCAVHRKPIALVFTKQDLNPDLKRNPETILSFPRVKQFREQFREDIAPGDKPFGVVTLLSAYVHDEFSSKVHRNPDNTIWLPAPAKVFSTILQAAWPQASQRLQAAVNKKKDEQQKAAAEEQHLKAINRRYIHGGIAAMVLVGLLIWLIPKYSRHVREQADVATVAEAADLLRQGQPERLDEQHYAALDRLGNSHYQADVDAARSKLEAAYLESLQKIPASVYKGSSQAEATRNLMRLPAAAGFPQDSAFDLLVLHKNILEAAGNCKAPAADSGRPFLDLVPTSATGQRDPAFIEALMAEADDLRSICAGEMAAAGKAQATLKDRISFIGTQLYAERKGMDPRWRMALHRSYAKFLGETLADLTAKNDVLAFLRASPLFQPLLAKASEESVQFVRYKFIMDEIEKLNLEGLAALRGVIVPSLKDFEFKTENPEVVNMKDTVQRLFGVEGDEPCDCASLWQALLDGADSQYLFVLRSDAWPPGHHPWKEELRSRLREARYSRDETMRIIDEISKRSMYWREVEGIASKIGDRRFGYEAGRLYNDAVQRVGDGSIANMQNSAQFIRQIAMLAEGTHTMNESYFGIDSAMLQRQRDAASELANRLESARNLPYSQSKPDAAGWLQEYCESQLSGYGVRCGN